MWDKESIEIYTAFLTNQEKAVFEALQNGIERLDEVEAYVSDKLNGNIDHKYVTAIWSRGIVSLFSKRMEAEYSNM